MEEAAGPVSEPARNLGQAEIDELLQQFAHSGANQAVAGDDRYSMHLQERGGVMWLAIRGVVMQAVPSEFSDRLQGLIDSGRVGPALVDMRRCTYLCSSALGVLSILLHGERRCGGKVVLLGASDKIRRMMELVGLGEDFVTVADEAEAARYITNLSKGKPA